MFPWSTENIEQWTKMQKNNWLCWCFCSMCQVFVFQDNFQIIQGVVSFAGLLKKICQKTIYLLNAHSKQFALFSGASAWQGARRITSYILEEKKSCDLSVESALGSGRCLLAHLSGDAGAGAGGGGAAGGDEEQEEQEHQEHLHTRFWEVHQIPPLLLLLLPLLLLLLWLVVSPGGSWQMLHLQPFEGTFKKTQWRKVKQCRSRSRLLVASDKCYTSWQQGNKSISDGKSDNIIPSKCNTSILGGKSHNLQQPSNQQEGGNWVIFQLLFYDIYMMFFENPRIEKWWRKRLSDIWTSPR